MQRFHMINFFQCTKGTTTTPQALLTPISLALLQTDF